MTNKQTPSADEDSKMWFKASVKARKHTLSKDDFVKLFVCRAEKIGQQKRTYEVMCTSVNNENNQPNKYLCPKYARLDQT